MGTSNSRQRKISNKLSISSKIKQELICPLCNKKFQENLTFQQLNHHLNECSSIQNKSNKNDKKYKKIDLSFDNKISKKSDKNNNKIKAPLRKYGSLIIEEISKNKIININSKEEKEITDNFSYNKKNKTDKKIKTIKGTFEERHNQMNDYFYLKKSQFKTESIIYGESIFQLLNNLINCNPYQKFIFVLKTDEKEEKYDYNEILFQYFDLMIKSKKFEIINGKTIYLPLNQKMDYELLGYILATLLIYPKYKINYKLPQLISKLLINEKIVLNDIQYENKDLYDYLIKLKNNNDISKLNISFNYEGNDLVKNGKNIQVDEHNLEEYIDKVIEYEINKNIKKLNKIKDSLFCFVPKNYIMNFNREELYQIFNRLI